jgi:hypothetical protein
MNTFETPRQAYVVTGDLGQHDTDIAVPYADSYYEAAQPPLTPMNFPEHAYAQTEAVRDEDDNYGTDLSGPELHPDSTPTDMDAYFAWAEPQFSEHPETQSFPTETEEGPEYLGNTGTDYEFTGPPTPTEDALADFRAWMGANPNSTPADPMHQARLAELYNTLDPRGNVAAAAAVKAARKAAENRAASMASPEADPTQTRIINVADVLGGIASEQSLSKEMDFSSSATDAPAQPEIRQRVSHRRQPGGRHAAAPGGRHRRAQ